MKEDSIQIFNRIKPNARKAFSKLEQIKYHIDSLENRMIVQSDEISEWMFKTCYYEKHGVYNGIEDWKKAEISMKWGGDDVTGFFRVKTIVPKKLLGTKIFLNLSFGGEALVYLNASPYQGLDFDRKLVPLNENFSEGQALDILVEISVRNAPYDAFRDDIRVHHVFEAANFIQVDSQIEDLYYDCWVVYDIARESENAEYSDFLLHNLELALRNLDFYEQDRLKFLEGVKAAKQMLEDKIYNCKSFVKNGKVCLVGQSHLDIVYLWPYKEFLRKNARTAMNMVRLLEEFPELKFAQSQGKLYSELKEKYPEVYTKVKEKISEGKWEPVGAFYVEPDCNIPSGESLIRQIIFGKRFYRKEFGNDPEVCWVPDVFGCMWTLPQILLKSGVKYLSSVKLTIWNDTNQFPYSNFQWEGPDGSKILVHFPAVHFAVSVEPKKILASWDLNKEKHITGESMYQFGLADGGGGPTRDMAAKLYRMRKFPGMPEMEFDTVINFFKRLEDKSSKLPIWQDELYLEAHRGTYTTKAQMKKANRKCELLLRDAEIYSVLAKIYGGDSRKQEIDDCWEKLLVNQFHDTLPGSHANQVVKETMDLYEEVCISGETIKNESLKKLTDKIAINFNKDSFVIFNSLSWERTGVIEFNISRNGLDFTIEEAETGRDIPYTTEIQDNGSLKVICVVFDIPAMGYKVFKIRDGQQEYLLPRASITDNVLDTHRFKVVMDEAGNLTSIYDKVHGRELIEGGAANKLQIFEDRPGKFSAWDIISSYKDNEISDIELLEVNVVENNYLRTVIDIRKRVMSSVVSQNIVFYHDLHRIDFVTHVDWKEREKLLKVGFPFAIRARNARYDIPFGNIERPTHQSTSWDRAKFEVYGHKWADLSETGFGISILNDCKYGYDVQDNIMRLTLLKAPIYPDPVSDLGEHDFSYAVYPHRGDWNEGLVTQAGYEFNVPMQVQMTKEHSGELPGNKFSWLKVSGSNTIIETLKEPENSSDNSIIRIYDACGNRGEVEVSSSLEVINAEEVNLMEEENISANFSTNKVNLYFKPYEIKTLNIKFSKGM